MDLPTFFYKICHKGAKTRNGLRLCGLVPLWLFLFYILQKNVAPKNRGDLTIACHMKNSYNEPANFNKQSDRSLIIS